MLGKSKVRTFTFEAGYAMSAIRDTIVAALDDEGLVIRTRQGERLVAVQRTIDGRELDVVAIPLSRIVPRLQVVPSQFTDDELAAARALVGLR